MDKQSSSDFLSNLPLSIIHIILELLPIRDAVQTSILSRQWRYKWTTLPRLSFLDNSTNSSKHQLKDFITQLLFLHQGPILEFELDVSVHKISQNIDQWLLFLSRNGVRRLVLRSFDELDCLHIHSSIYSFQNLTRLEFFNCEFPSPPPFFKGFMSLRCLVLELVCVPSSTIQALLIDLTLLEELRLHECGRDLDLKIHAPNLKILYLSGVFRGISLYAPLLRISSINFENDLISKKSTACIYNEFLGDLSNLEELKGSLYFFKYLSIGIEYCHISLMLDHLRFIELSPIAFYDKKVESIVARLCMCAPNLHKIRVSYSFSGGLKLASDALPLDSKCPFDFIFEKLKVIEIGYVGGGDRWMKLVKYLLASSPALEKLICEPPSGLTERQLRKHGSMLLSYPRASSNVNIVFGKNEITSISL